MCGVVVLNSQDIELFQEQFFCPKCFTKRPYQVKPVSLGIRFYYISLFENGGFIELVVCQVCKNAFDPQVLNPYSQNLFKLAGAARYEMRQGLAPEDLKSKLVGEGIREELANKLIALAQI